MAPPKITLPGRSFGDWGFVPDKAPSKADIAAQLEAIEGGKTKSEYDWFSPEALRIIVDHKLSKALGDKIRPLVQKAGGAFWARCTSKDASGRKCGRPYQHDDIRFNKSTPPEIVALMAHGTASTEARQATKAQDVSDPRLMSCSMHNAFPIGVGELYDVAASERRMRKLLAAEVVHPSNRDRALRALHERLKTTTVGYEALNKKTGTPEVREYKFTAKGEWDTSRYEATAPPDGAKFGLLKTAADGTRFVKDPLDLVVALAAGRDEQRRFHVHSGALHRCQFAPYECRTVKSACHGVLRASLYELFHEPDAKPSPSNVERTFQWYADNVNATKLVADETRRVLQASGAYGDEHARRAFESQGTDRRRPLRFMDVDGEPQLVHAPDRALKTLQTAWREHSGLATIPADRQRLQSLLLGDGRAGLTPEELDEMRAAEERKAVFRQEHVSFEIEIDADGATRVRPPGAAATPWTAAVPAGAAGWGKKLAKVQRELSRKAGGAVRGGTIEDVDAKRLTVRLQDGRSLALDNPSRFQRDPDRPPSLRTQLRRQAREQAGDREPTLRDWDDGVARGAARAAKQAAAQKTAEKKKRIERVGTKAQRAVKQKDQRQQKQAAKDAVVEQQRCDALQGAAGERGHAKFSKHAVCAYVPGAAEGARMDAPRRGPAHDKCGGGGGFALLPYQRTGAEHVAGRAADAEGKNLLIVHSTGSGKTCSMVAIIARVRQHELRAGKDPKEWKKIYIVAPPRNLNDAFKAVIGGCGVLQFTDAPEGKEEAVCKRFGVYGYTYIKFANRATGGTRDKDFDLRNALILFDEAHNFAPEYRAVTKRNTAWNDQANQTEDSKNAAEALKLLRRARDEDGARIVLLTATPIKYDASEAGVLLDLLGAPGVPTGKAAFASAFAGKAGLDAFVRSAKELVSYYDGTLDVSRFATLIASGADFARHKKDMDGRLAAAFAALPYPYKDELACGFVRVPASNYQFAKWTACVSTGARAPTAEQKDEGRQLQQLRAAAAAAKKAFEPTKGAFRDALLAQLKGASSADPTVKEMLAAHAEATSKLPSAPSKQELAGAKKALLERIGALVAARASRLKAERDECKRMEAVEKCDDRGRNCVQYLLNPSVEGDAVAKLRTQLGASNAVKRLQEVKETKAGVKGTDRSVQYVEWGDADRARFQRVLAVDPSQQILMLDRDDEAEEGAKAKRMMSLVLRQCYPSRADPSEDDWASARRTLQDYLANPENGVSPKLWALVANLLAIKAKGGGKSFVFTASHPKTGVQAIAAALTCAGFQQLSFSLDKEDAKRLSALRARLEKAERDRKRAGDAAAKSALAATIDGLQQEMARFDGWKLSAPPDPRYAHRTFVVLPMTTNKGLQTAMLDKMFNKDDNKQGAICPIVVANAAYKTGITLKGVNWVHLFDEPPSKTDRDQALARAIRLCSAKALGFGAWFVFLLSYVSPAPADTSRLLSDGEAFVRGRAQFEAYRRFLCGLQRAAIDRCEYAAVPGNDACGEAQCGGKQ